MSTELDLWTGMHAETGDDTWMAFEYNDGAVQFIKQDTHDIVWQGRTVVGEGSPAGRIEAHYSFSEDVVFLVAATGHAQPPKAERIIETDEFRFDFDDLDEETCEYVLETLLAEWVKGNQLSSPSYPPQSALSTLTTLTAGSATDAKAKSYEERTPQEQFDVGVGNIATSNPR